MDSFEKRPVHASLRAIGPLQFKIGMPCQARPSKRPGRIWEYYSPELQFT
jgi:hypothetical protein